MNDRHQPVVEQTTGDRVSRRTALRGAGVVVAAGALGILSARSASASDGSAGPDGPPPGARSALRAGGQTSANGWPWLPDNSPTLTVIPGIAGSPRVLSGAVATVLTYVAVQFNNRVEKITSTSSFRYDVKIAGYPNLFSNHSSGTALDFNGGKHPVHTRTFTTAQVAEIGRIVNEAQVITWGGNFIPKDLDEMHFEIRAGVTEAQVQAAAKALGGIPDRVLVVRTDGTLAAKEALTGPVIELKTGVARVAADRDRVAVIGTNGRAEIKVGGLTEPWITLMDNAKDVALDGDRIIVLGTDGKAWAKDGVYSSWTQISGSTTVIDASDGRIGVIEAGAAKVKEGGITNAWTTVASSASDLSLDGARVGVVEGGTVKVKEGPLTSAWVNQIAGRRVVVEGYRIGVLGADGNAFVKDGALTSGWTQVGNGTDIDVAGDRVALVSGGWAVVKEPNLNSGWVNIISGAKQVVLANQ